MDTAGVSSNYAPKRLFVYAPKRLFVHGDLFFRLYLMVSGHSTGLTVVVRAVLIELSWWTVT